MLDADAQTKHEGTQSRTGVTEKALWMALGPLGGRFMDRQEAWQILTEYTKN